MAVYGKEQLKLTISAEISDNVTGEISPRDVRHNLIDIVDSVSTIITTDNISTLNFSTPPTRNTRVGELALSRYISSVDNTAVGYQALLQSYTSVRNTAIGVDAMHCHMVGQNNTAIGYRSLYSNTRGSGNVALGAYALRDNVWGSGNVAIGDGAGCYEEGNYRLYIANHSVGPSCDSSNKPNPLIYGEFESVRVGIGTRSLSGLGTLEVAGNITPSQDCQFSLGASTRRWKDLYLCGTLFEGTLSGVSIIGAGGGCGLRLNSDGDVLPICDGQDIGASGLMWNDGYFNGIIYDNSLSFGDENGDNWSQISNNGLCLQASGLNRWCLLRNDEPEIGSNFGSNFELNRYNDAGSFLNTDIFILRPSGYIGINTTTPSCNLDVVGDVCIEGDLDVVGTATYKALTRCVYDCVTLYLASSGVCGDGGYPCAISDDLFIASGGFILKSSGDGIIRDKEFIYNPAAYDYQAFGCGHPREYWTSNINLEVEPGNQIRTDSVQGHQHLFVSNSGCHGLYLKDDDTTGLGTQQPKTKFNIVSSGTFDNGVDSVIRNTSLGSGVTVSLELLAKFNDPSDGNFEGFDVKYIDDSNPYEVEESPEGPTSERFAVGSYNGSSAPINAFVIMRNPDLAGFVGITNISENPLPASIFNIQATGDAIVRVFASGNLPGGVDVSSLQLLGSGNTPKDGFEIEYNENNERADFSIYNSSTTKTQAITIKKSNQYVGIGTTNPTERLTVASRIAMKEDTTPSTTSGFGKLYCKSTGKIYFLNDEGTEYDLTSAAGGGGGDLTAISGVNWDDYENTWGGKDSFVSHVTDVSPSVGAAGNTLYGDETGTAITAGDSNTLIGANAGKAITDGSSNVFVGYDAGALSTGTNNVFLGVGNGLANLTGNSNTFLGDAAGSSNTGSSNVFIGISAGEEVGNASSSTFVLSTLDNVLASGSFSTQDFYLTGPLHTPYIGSKKDIISGGTRTQSAGYPDGDGFRIRGDSDFFGVGLDALIIEKTAGTQNDPDGGIAFVNTGNDGTESTALVIRGDNKIGIGTKDPTEKLTVHDGDIKLSGDGSCLVFNDGTSICTAPTGGSGGTGDITKVSITAGDGLTGTVTTLTGDHTQTLETMVSDLTYGGITHDGNNNLKLNHTLAGFGLEFTQDNSAGQVLGVDLNTLSVITRVNITAGDGLTGNVDTLSGDHTQTLDIDVSDFAGDGLSDDGSENLELDIDSLSVQATAIVDADLIAISKGGDTQKVPASVISDFISSGDGVPAGSMVAFGSTVVPDGWIGCDGAEVSRTTYADLFAVIGVIYGAGNESTTFNVPDLRQRYPRGIEPSKSDYTDRGIAFDIGDTCDDISDFVERDEGTLLAGNLPDHQHSLPADLCNRVTLDDHDSLDVAGHATLTHQTGTNGLLSATFDSTEYDGSVSCMTSAADITATEFQTIDPFLGVVWIIKY